MGESAATTAAVRAAAADCPRVGWGFAGLESHVEWA